MKKIVIISYATFPRISPRSMRTNELAKELAREGHDVTLYVLTGNYNYKDYEKETNIKVKSLGRTFFLNFDPQKGTSTNLFSKVLTKLLGKLIEFPSIELLFNSYFSIKKEKNIDLLITVAVPYPLHWGTALFRSINKKKLKNTIWVADCGDPYMGNTFFKHLFYFKYIEKWFCHKADYISIPIEEAKEGYYPEFHKKIKIIPQGFDFHKMKKFENYKKNKIPTFIYAGNFYKNLRNPEPLIDYLSTLNIDFKFIVYTNDIYFIEIFKKKLSKKVEIFDFIPRDKLLIEMSQSDFLINLENPTTKQSPSKLIDYALSGRPILSINTNKKIDTEIIDQFLCGNYKNSYIIENIEKYDIKNVAKQFILLLNK